MKKEKFDFSKFILDCFVCVALMIVSIAIFIKPLYYLYGSFGKAGLRLFKCDFYDLALEFSILSLVPFIIIYFLYKADIIQLGFYRIYKSSFLLCFVLLTSFWWLCAMNFCTGPIK